MVRISVRFYVHIYDRMYVYLYLYIRVRFYDRMYVYLYNIFVCFYVRMNVCYMFIYQKPR